jgi:phenylacetate-CoA ligase
MVVNPVSAYQTALDGEVAAVVTTLASRNAGFRHRLQAAGLETADLRTVADLDRLPIVTKDQVMDMQRASPPFGGLLSDDAALRRVYQSPGPIYEPEPNLEDPWRFARALSAAGFGPDDIVLNAFAYHLSPAGAMFDEACQALGATLLPAGVGNKNLQVQACLDLGITAYIGPPSYLKALLERVEEMGVDSGLKLERAFVSGEPLPPSLRSWLSERVTTIRQGYGTAEAGHLAYECDQLEGMHVADDAIVQVCDLTSGAALEDETEGQVVVTLSRTDYAVVRFGTGDLSAWVPEPCPCGRRTPRLRGWLGRVGAAVKVRGMFLHPRQVERVVRGVQGVADYRMIIDRTEHRDVVRCEIVPDGDRRLLTERVGEAIRAGLRFACEVTVVAPLPRDAERFIDARTWE